MPKKSFDKMISKITKKKEWEYISKVTLDVDGKSEKFEYIIIGHFGIILLIPFDFKGDLYGTKTDRNWALHEKKYKTPIENPILRLDRQTNLIRAVLPKEKIYKVNIEHDVVFLTNPKKLLFFSTAPNCSYLNTFKKKISSEKYMIDRGVNPQKIKEALLKYIAE